MAWTDEKDGSFNKSVFSGKDSPINVMTYNITKTPLMKMPAVLYSEK